MNVSVLGSQLHCKARKHCVGLPLGIVPGAEREKDSGSFSNRLAVNSRYNFQVHLFYSHGPILTSKQ